MPRIRPNKPSNTRPHRLRETRQAMAVPRLKAALCHDAYTKIGLRAPNNTKMKQTARVSAIQMASLCISVRWVTRCMGTTTWNLVKTTKQLVEAIKLDGIVFLDLTLGDATTSSLLYDTPGDLPLPSQLGSPKKRAKSYARRPPGLPNPGGKEGWSNLMHRHRQQGRQMPRTDSRGQTQSDTHLRLRTAPTRSIIFPI